MTISYRGISFRNSWKPVLISALAFLCLSVIVILTTVPMYRAESTFLISPNANLTSSRDIVTSLDTLDNKTISTTYSKIMGSGEVFQDTLRLINLKPENLTAYHVHSAVETDANILSLYVEGPDPSMAALLANNIGQNAINYIKNIYQVFDISFLDHAVVPEKPFRPLPLLYALIGTGVGILFGLIAVLLNQALRVPLAAIRERAITDPESLAYTRKHLVRELIHEIGLTKTEPVAFGLLEISGLEDLADALPERYFVNLMQQISTILHNQLRGNDVVGRWEKISFGVLLPSTPEAPAIRTFERIRSEFNTPMVIDEAGQTVQLSPIIGLTLRKAGESADSMIDRAKKALAQANQEGKSLVILSGEKG